MTFKYNNYKLYIHGKIGKDYQRSAGSRQDQIYEGVRGSEEGGNCKKPQPEPHGGKDTLAKGGLVRRASSQSHWTQRAGGRGGAYLDVYQDDYVVSCVWSSWVN